MGKKSNNWICVVLFGVVAVMAFKGCQIGYTYEITLIVKSIEDGRPLEGAELVCKSRKYDAGVEPVRTGVDGKLVQKILIDQREYNKQVFNGTRLDHYEKKSLHDTFVIYRKGFVDEKIEINYGYEPARCAVYPIMIIVYMRAIP